MMTAKKKVRRKKHSQKMLNARGNFDSSCMSWRPVFDRCLSLDDDGLYSAEVPEAVMEKLQQISKKHTASEAVGVIGFAVQTLIIGYGHLLNCLEPENPGIKKQALRQFLNGMFRDNLAGLPSGE